MDSNVGLAIQAVGILLITLLSLFMRGSINSPALKYWTAAWASLSLSLVVLFVGFQLAGAHAPFYSLYFLGEYLFGLLFIAGCRNHASGARMSPAHVYLLVPAMVVAALLPYLSKDFNDLFMVHATLLAGLFGVAFWILRTGTAKKKSPGTSVMLTALCLLTVGFIHYVPVFGFRNGFWGVTVPAGYLQLTSIIDLLIEVLLGFGTIMVLMERVREEVETANRELLSTRDQLECLVRLDPLTEALNRHAFHSFLNGREVNRISGCVALIDIDNLKPINDTLGHSAGDRAIRSVAKGMRLLVRADDMLFRWGGDEFLVLMFGLPEAEVARRLETLNDILEAHCREWTDMPSVVTVSHGVAGFNSLEGLAESIELADKRMYEQRQEVRALIGKDESKRELVESLAT